LPQAGHILIFRLEKLLTIAAQEEEQKILPDLDFLNWDSSRHTFLRQLGFAHIFLTPVTLA